jgi:hypothetical protein
MTQEHYIIQVKSKRKNADWRDYMVFNALEGAVKQITDMRERPHHHMLDRRSARLIHRELSENIIINDQ